MGRMNDGKARMEIIDNKFILVEREEREMEIGLSRKNG